MSQVTPRIRNFARRLLVYEMRNKNSSDVQPHDTFHVCEKLRPLLATLMGTGGFRALLSRALVLTNAEVSGLRAVGVNDVGILESHEESQSQLNSRKFFEGQVVLTANLLVLLMAFIGEDLTVRLVRDVWPDFQIDDSGFR